MLWLVIPSSLSRPKAFRGVGRSILLTLPMALWALLMFTPAFQKAGRDLHIGAALTIVFMTGAFLPDDADGRDLSLAADLLCRAGISVSVRVHRCADRRARHHEHSRQPHGLGRHAVLLHGDAIDDFAGGVRADDYFSGLDSAHARAIRTRSPS